MDPSASRLSLKIHLDPTMFLPAGCGTRTVVQERASSKVSSSRSIAAITACHDWEVGSSDFNSTYLNRELDNGEATYMQPPPGYESGGGCM